MKLTPERWEQVEELFHAALEREPNERARFLSEACSSDPRILAEVESLIIAHEQPGSFIDSPAYEMVAEQISGSHGESLVGQAIGHYRILALLGKGGMGEVYQAKDLRLDRVIALKLLPHHLTENKERLGRFNQEARVASALNHPNVITIHEVGQADGAYYIATEFVDGETLRQRLKEGRLDIVEALDIAIQTGRALGAAHRAGIVHRDVKPENIMLRPDGYVKVLDFGLATFTERQMSDERETSDANLQDMTWVNTAPGIIMGTVNYMSPEQARGVALDERTDIFSLGIVLYEMIAGHPPFEGETATDVIASILKTEPAPLTFHLPETPPEIQWVLNKALRKNRDDRYQTIKGMIADLKNLKQDIEIQSRLEHSLPSGVGSAISGSRAVSPKSGSLAASEAKPIITTLSTEYIIEKINSHTKIAVVVLITIVFAIAALGFWVSRLIGPTEKISPFQTMKINRLTDTGKAHRAAVSPDGRYVVHVLRNAGQQSLWVRQVATNSNIEIAAPAEINYLGLTFSRDGEYIYFTLRDKANATALYQVPALGGGPRKILENVDGPVTFSPDGRQFAFVREETSLMIANVDGSGERLLARRGGNEFWRYPAWSPDGKIIACGVGDFSISDDYVVEVSARDGREKPVTPRKWLRVYGMAWLSDGSGLVMSAVDQESKLPQIWSLSYPYGAERRITNDLSTYAGPSLTSDSSKLVCVLGNRLSDIWVAPDGNASLAKRITFDAGNDDGVMGISWMPDGKIVYASGEKGNQDIWITEADGTGKKQLTIEPQSDYFPSVSLDGRYIVFASNRAGNFNIWRMDIDGGNPKQLTDRGGESWPYCSPDGRWVIYQVAGPDKWTIWKVPIDGGDPVQLTDKDSGVPSVSPDGKWIACLYRENGSESPPKVAIISVEGGPPSKMLAIASASGAGIFRWSPDSRALTYIKDSGGTSNIWSQPLDGEPPRQLTEFKNDRIWEFHWSQDGKQLICSRGSETFDAVMIRDFK